MRTAYIGRSGSGKTALMLHHFGQSLSKRKEKRKKKPFNILYSPLREHSEERESFLTPNIYRHIHAHYDDINEDTAADTTELIHRVREKDHPVNLFFDDFGPTKMSFFKKQKGNPFGLLFQAAPHQKTNVSFVAQRFIHLPLDLRGSAENSYIFAPEGRTEMEHVWKNYAGHVDKTEFFRKARSLWGNFTDPEPFKYMRVERKPGMIKRYYEGKGPSLSDPGYERPIDFSMGKLK